MVEGYMIVTGINRFITVWRLTGFAIGSY